MYIIPSLGILSSLSLLPWNVYGDFATVGALVVTTLTFGITYSRSRRIEQLKIIRELIGNRNRLIEEVDKEKDKLDDQLTQKEKERLSKTIRSKYFYIYQQWYEILFLIKSREIKDKDIVKYYVKLFGRDLYEGKEDGVNLQGILYHDYDVLVPFIKKNAKSMFESESKFEAFMSLINDVEKQQMRIIQDRIAEHYYSLIKEIDIHDKKSAKKIKKCISYIEETYENGNLTESDYTSLKTRLKEKNREVSANS